MSNYDSHYHPNSQVSEAEMDNLYTVLDDEQAAIIAHAKLVGKQRTYRMPVGQHPADVTAALDEVKASLMEIRMARFSKCERREINTSSALEMYAYSFAAGVLAGQIVSHL